MSNKRRAAPPENRTAVPVDRVTRTEWLAMIGVSVAVTGIVAAILVAVMVYLFDNLDGRINSLQEQFSAQNSGNNRIDPQDRDDQAGGALSPDEPTPSPTPAVATFVATPAPTPERYTGEASVIGPSSNDQAIKCDPTGATRYHDDDLVAAVPIGLLGTGIECYSIIRVCIEDVAISRCVNAVVVTSFSEAIAPGRIVNLSTAAASEIEVTGIATVTMEPLGKEN